jgi:hypothetical protein
MGGHIRGGSINVAGLDKKTKREDKDLEIIGKILRSDINDIKDEDGSLNDNAYQALVDTAKAFGNDDIYVDKDDENTFFKKRLESLNAESAVPSGNGGNNDERQNDPTESREKTERGNNGLELRLGKDHNFEEIGKFFDECGFTDDKRIAAGFKSNEDMETFAKHLGGKDGIVGKGDMAQFEGDDKQIDPKKVQDYMTQRSL